MRTVELPGRGRGERTCRPARTATRRTSSSARFTIAAAGLQDVRDHRAGASCGRKVELPIDPDAYTVEQVFYPLEGRHPGAHVPRAPQGPEAGRHATRRCSTATAASTSSLHADLPRQHLPVAGRGRACTRWPTCAAAASTARRGTRRARWSTSRTSSTTSTPRPSTWSRGLHAARAAGHLRRQQRRPAGGRGDDPAAGALRRGGVRGAAARHGALPPVRQRQDVDPRVRHRRERRGLQVLVRLLALPPRAGRACATRRC